MHTPAFLSMSSLSASLSSRSACRDFTAVDRSPRRVVGGPRVLRCRGGARVVGAANLAIGCRPCFRVA